LTPVPPGEDLDTGLEAALRTTTGAVAVGAGEAVPLADPATGYEQAFHALAVARHDPARFARFSARTELAALVGPGDLQWARQELAALAYVPPAGPHDSPAVPCLDTLLAAPPARQWTDVVLGPLPAAGPPARYDLQLALRTRGQAAS